MAQVKFDRNYFLTIELADRSELTIFLPATIEFNITRNILSSANNCEIRLYNLSPKNRDLIRFDFSDYGTSFRKVKLNAGYGTNLPQIFIGNINQAWSFREGTEFVTTIQCFDGGDSFVNGAIPGTATFPAGTPMQTVYKTLMGYLPDISFGAIGDSFIYGEGGSILSTTRSSSYTGNVVENLRALSGSAFFIDNGKSYILGNNEYISGSISEINSQSGLLNTPLRERNQVTLEMVFEPYLKVGQRINLETQTFSRLNSSSENTTANVNGLYKIVSLNHKGLISGAICGKAITTVGFFSGLAPLKRVGPL